MATIINREQWQDSDAPVAGPADAEAGGTWVIHDPGSSSPKFPKTDAEARAHLRRAHAAYLRDRGYSYGYSFTVAQFGLSYEVRGFDQRPASNPGKKVPGNFNHRSRSIQMMVGQQDPASPEAVREANGIIAMRPNWGVLIHGDVDYTACCNGIIGQVRAGVIGQGMAGQPVFSPPVSEDNDLAAAGYNPPHNWWWFPLDKNKPELRQGAQGSHVRYLQDVIFYYGGGDIVVDGKFGPAIQRRVQDIQKMFNITNDGVVGSKETWPVVDYLVTLNAPAPPVEELTPTAGVVQVKNMMYYVESGDSPWSVAELAYGSGLENGRIDTAGFKTFSTPNNPHRIITPGVTGLRTEVLSGEGPLMTLDRLGSSRDKLETFYAWNGGWERVFHPGDTVYMPT